MYCAAKIFNEDGIDSYRSLRLVLRFDNVPDCESTLIAGVFKVHWSEYSSANLVKNFARTRPFGKERGRLDRGRTLDILIFVVFLAALNDAVIHNILDRVKYFTFWSRNFHG